MAGKRVQLVRIEESMNCIDVATRATTIIGEEAFCYRLRSGNMILSDGVLNDEEQLDDLLEEVKHLMLLGHIELYKDYGLNEIQEMLDRSLHNEEEPFFIFVTDLTYIDLREDSKIIFTMFDDTNTYVLHVL